MSDFLKGDEVYFEESGIEKIGFFEKEYGDRYVILDKQTGRKIHFIKDMIKIEMATLINKYLKEIE